MSTPKPPGRTLPPQVWKEGWNSDPDPSKPWRKCIECGYLALYEVESPELREANMFFRQSLEGQRPGGIFTGSVRIFAYPLCFVEAYNLSGDTQQAYLARTGVRFDPEGPNKTVLPPDTPSLKAVLEITRKCEPYVDWSPGFSPKEHREMIDRKQMLQWQAEREEADRDFRASQAAEERKWRKDERKWRIVELIIMGGIVTAVLVAAQLIAAFIQRSSTP